MNKIISVSFPRSGHHLIADCILQYFSKDLSVKSFRKDYIKKAGIFYCESYEHCQRVPCKDKRTNFQKTHDLKLELKKKSGYKYLIIYRNPLEAIVSRFLLEISKEHQIWKRQKREGRLKDTKTGWEIFANENILYYKGFIKKWVLSKNNNCILVSYEELIKEPKDILKRIIKLFSPNLKVNEPLLEKVIKNNDIKKKSDIKKFKYYDKVFFNELRSKVKDELDELKQMNPGIEAGSISLELKYLKDKLKDMTKN